MSSWEIIIPIIWAGGLLGLTAFLLRKSEDGFRLEFFFPVIACAGLLIYLLGLMNIWHKYLFIGLTVILGLFAVWGIIKSPFLRWLSTLARSNTTALSIFMLGLTWFGLASLSYPVSTDALAFHLGLPKTYALSGHMFFTPNVLFSAGPRIMEMITTGFYFLGLERGSQLFILFISAAVLLNIGQRARELGGHGYYAALIFLATPIFLAHVIGAKNDYLLWGLSFFSALQFIKFQETLRLKNLLMAAAGAGLAAGTKAIGLGLVGALACLLIYQLSSGRNKLRHLFYFLAVSISVSSPWYVYSWLVVGNPVFPFFDSIFHSPFTTPLLEQFNHHVAVPRVPADISNFLFAPLRLIFEPERFDGRFGYALALFPAILIFIPRISNKIKICMGISASMR
jgi:hypothetical protein